MSNPEYFVVIQGEDRTLSLNLRSKDCTPFNLTGAIDIKVRFKKSTGGYLEKNFTNGVSVVDAILGRIAVALTEIDTALFQVGERLDFSVIIDKGAYATATSSGTTYTAIFSGTLGNSISLVFDGIKTVQTVVNAWNTANVSNTVSFSPGGNASVVPSSGTVTLSGGINAKRKANFLRAITVRKEAV